MPKVGIQCVYPAIKDWALEIAEGQSRVGLPSSRTDLENQLRSKHTYKLDTSGAPAKPEVPIWIDIKNT